MKAEVLLFVLKRTRASSVVQTFSDSSLSVSLGGLDHLKSLQRSLVVTTWINVVIILCLFVKTSMFLLLSLSLILPLVCM